MTDLTITRAAVDSNVSQMACQIPTACGLATRYWEVEPVLQVHAIVADSPNGARQDTYLSGQKSAVYILRDDEGAIIQISESVAGSATFRRDGATICVQTTLPPTDGDGGSPDADSPDASGDSGDAGSAISEVCVRIAPNLPVVGSLDAAAHLADLQATCPGGPHHLDEGMTNPQVQKDPASSGACAIGLPSTNTSSSLAGLALAGVLLMGLRRRRAHRRYSTQ